MHLFRAVYATLAVHYHCPPRVNGILFKAGQNSTQCHSGTGQKVQRGKGSRFESQNDVYRDGKTFKPEQGHLLSSEIVI